MLNCHFIFVSLNLFDKFIIMEYMKLIAGIVFLMTFGWLLVRNIDRKGFMHGLFRIDTIIGIVAGLYLVITSFISIL